MPNIFGLNAAQTIQCGTCFKEFDPEEECSIKLLNQPVCGDCKVMCGCNCGEYLTDDSVAVSGPIVHYRDIVYSGQLVAAHAECAADTLIGYLGDGLSYDHSTKEEIALALYESMFPQQVAR